MYTINKLLCRIFLPPWQCSFAHQRTKVGRRRRRNPARLLPLLHRLCSGISRLSRRPYWQLTRQGRPGLLARTHGLAHGLVHRPA